MRQIEIATITSAVVRVILGERYYEKFAKR